MKLKGDVDGRELGTRLHLAGVSHDRIARAARLSRPTVSRQLAGVLTLTPAVKAAAEQALRERATELMALASRIMVGVVGDG